MPTAALIKKYDVPAPRYTSYPTVPYWETTPSRKNWMNDVAEQWSKEGISLYVHLPFCDSLCTFCGCNKRITVNHEVEQPYMERVLKEWQFYLRKMDTKPLIKELHLGGGTPTFFSASHLYELVEQLLKAGEVSSDAQLGFEAHPKSTSLDKLKALRDLGFQRLSIGVQDFDPKVQAMINRHNPYEMVKEVMANARSLGYSSINMDIVYGLPGQHIDSVQYTLEKVRDLKPDRLAYYSYAHVPWKIAAQKRYNPSDLPSKDEKRRQYEMGRKILEKAGYQEIGMDHFALKTDALYQASQAGQLHRNFMGYTVARTSLLIGLGASAISDTGHSYKQNVKTVEDYQDDIDEKEFSILRGHELSTEDEFLRHHIERLMCDFKTDWDAMIEQHFPVLKKVKQRLAPLVDDGLVKVDPYSIQVTEKGKPFIRNICMALDERLWEAEPQCQLFSQAI